MLLRLLHYLQQSLAPRLSFPRLVDYVAARFEPPLPLPPPHNSIGSEHSSTQ